MCVPFLPVIADVRTVLTSLQRTPQPHVLPHAKRVCVCVCLWSENNVSYAVCCGLVELMRTACHDVPQQRS